MKRFFTVEDLVSSPYGHCIILQRNTAFLPANVINTPIYLPLEMHFPEVLYIPCFGCKTERVKLKYFLNPRFEHGTLKFYFRTRGVVKGLSSSQVW